MAVLRPGEPFGPFRLVKRLGGGGQAEVWLAQKIGSLDKQFALKLFASSPAEGPLDRGHHDHLRELFLREAHLTAQFHHPNIVSVIELGTERDYLWMLQEYVQGEDLARILARVERFPVELALYVATSVCMALEAAHSRRAADGKSVVHRDIKPANILISQGHVKLADFGVAKLVSAAPTLTRLSGTYGYFAPELFSVGGSPSPASDLFSVGVVLWEMLAGRRLFVAASEPEWVAVTLACEVPPLPEVSPEVQRVVRAFLARAPRDRHADAGAALRALRALPEGRRASAFELRSFIGAQVDTVLAEAAAFEAVPLPIVEDHRTMMPARLRTASIAGESVAPAATVRARPVRRRAPWLAVAGLAVAGAAVTALVAGGSSKPPEPMPVAASAPAPAVTAGDAAPAPKTVDAGAARSRITVVTEPADAQLSADGERVPGKSPFSIERPRGALLKLRIERDGFIGQQPEVRVDSDALSVPIKLMRAPHRAAPPARDDSPLTPIRPQPEADRPGVQP